MTEITKKRKTLDSFFKPQKKKTTESEEEEEQSKSKEPIKVPSEHKDLLSLEYTTIDGSWLNKLEPELRKPYFLQLKRFLQSQQATIYPLPEDIYSWTRHCPFKSIQVVILGQDPYHGPQQAHGLAFSVQPGTRVPPSLCNMYKALAKDYPEAFKAPKHGYLGGWAEQGVLLLNAALTVEKARANSHAGKGWEQFTDRVIQLINQERQHVVFMLWGAYAQKKGAQVDKSKHCVLKSVHPSPLSASRGFFDCGHFRKANKYLTEHNKQPIDWNHLPNKT